MSVSEILRDPGFEGWLVDRILNDLARRGVRLPEYVACELKPVSDGVRMRLIEFVELDDGYYGEIGVFYEVSFNHQEIKYLYEEYRAEKARAIRVLG
jgi:hypothetical protein